MVIISEQFMEFGNILHKIFKSVNVVNKNIIRASFVFKTGVHLTSLFNGNFKNERN
jgi:hypothetical protein